MKKRAHTTTDRAVNTCERLWTLATRKTLGLLWAVLWIAVTVPPVARSQGEIELRISRLLLLSLVSPDEWRRPSLRQELLEANPWARDVRIRGDAARFYLSWELPDGGRIGLYGGRLPAYRSLLGAPESIERLLEYPEGYELLAVTRDSEGFVATLAPREPGERISEVPEEAPSLLEVVRDATTLSLRLLASHRYQKPVLGSVNPDNAVLDLPRQTSEGETRLDFFFDWDRLSLSAKPRARYTRDHWEDGEDSGETDYDSDLLLLEGAARLRLIDSLFASFGRETLQWGPAQFVNPSNPFTFDNGRDNPVREIPGSDYVRGVWLPTFSLTASWISNLWRGEAEMGGRPFDPSHAFKLDWVGTTANAGILGHGGDEFEPTFRGYAQWTATDALLLYGEWSLSLGSRARYPVKDETNPVGGRLEETKKDNSNLYVFSTLGGGYTLALGPTLTLEYVHNGEGYDDDDADLFFDLAHRAGVLDAEGLLSVNEKDVSPRLRLLRRNYLFFQYLHTEILGRLDLILRWTQNLDDQSGLFSGYFGLSLGDRFTFFGQGLWGTGGNRDEYGSVIRYAGVLGLEFAAF